ncbi:hypothetical protein M407DRAFT_245982, partial [Tulasnella calospora MUT 4182]
MLKNPSEEAIPRCKTGLRGLMSLRSVELRGRPELRVEGLVEEIRRIIGGADVFWAN